MDCDSEPDSVLFDVIEKGFEEVLYEEQCGNAIDSEAPSQNTSRTYTQLEADDDLVVDCFATDLVATSVNEYLDQTITSNLEQLKFNWQTECLLCAELFDTFQELLEHCIDHHKNELSKFNCIFSDCNASLIDKSQLARHLILAHSDLRSLQIYGNCPHCEKRFSNFPQLNKHSCYSKLRRKPGRSNYCHICKDDFISFKRFIFHLQFHLIKRRPKSCLICDKEFLDINELFVHVNYDHEPPETMACSICDRIFQDSHAFESHQLLHQKKKKMFSCKLCPRTYHEKHSLAAHCEVAHQNTPEFKCGDCSKIFVTESHLARHMKCHSSNPNIEAHVCSGCGVISRDKDSLLKHTIDVKSMCFNATVIKEFLSIAYTCYYCELDFKEKNDLKNHLEAGEHDNGKYICQMCGIEFDSFKFLRLHLKSHRDYKLWMSSFPLKRFRMCDSKNCGETFVEWSALQRHKSRHHKPNTCTLCNISLPNSTEYEHHIANCNAVPQHICQFCGKEYPTKMALSVHIARSHNNNNIPCPDCNSSYKDEEALQQHIENFHARIPCQYCHKIIKNKRALELHIRSVHKGDHRFFCKVCNKGYHHRCQMDLHERHVHTDNVQKCSKCDFSTNYPKSLELHMQKHNNDCQLLCTQCGRAFNRKQALELHMKRHLGDKRYVCSERIADGCEAAFISHYLLNQHIKQKHTQALTASKPKRIKKTINTTPSKRKKHANMHASPLPLAEEEQTDLNVGMNTELQFVENVFDIDVGIGGTAPFMSNTLFGDYTENGLLSISSEANRDCMLLVVDDTAMPLVAYPNAEYVIVDNAQQLQLFKIDELNI